MDEKKKAAMLSHIDEIPEGINYRQLIFFVALNQYVTPQVRAQAQVLIGDKIIGPQQTRAIIEQVAEASVQKEMVNVQKMIQQIVAPTTMSCDGLFK
jgi:hypothetical protein